MRLKYNFLILPVLFCLIYACQEDLNTIFHKEEIKREQNIKEARAIFETLSPDFPCLQARSANAATKSVIIEPILISYVMIQTDLRITTVEVTHRPCLLMEGKIFWDDSSMYSR